jgi:lipopolysaccharide transport system ATP-binding protein
LTTSEWLLELDGVTRTFGGFTALRGVTLRLPRGRVGLLGPNGAGKSTLLRALAGVLPADEGRIVIRGRVRSLLSVDGGLMPQLTGRENAVLLGVLAGLPRRRMERTMDSIVRETELGDAFDRPVRTYSVGMRARLGLAVLEVADPNVLLLDEVHEALDERHRARLAEQVRVILAGGGIVVAAGHDRDALAHLCERTLHVAGGGVSGAQVPGGGAADAGPAHPQVAAAT